MRKIGIILFSLIFLVALTACSNSKDEAGGTESASSKGETIEVTVEDASYILAGQGAGDEEEGGILLINLQIKNLADSSIDIFPDMHMQLYEGDNQIDPSSERHHALDLAPDSNSSIGANKQKSMSVMFNVDKDTEYELNISTMPVDFEKEAEDVIVPIDTSEYNDSLEALQDPGKALVAYVETIFFDKDNSDYEKYVSADKNGIQDDAIKQFADSLERGISGEVSDSDIEKYYEGFKQASAEKDEIEVEVLGNANDKAIVKLDYSALSYDDMSKELKKYKEKYRDKHDEFDVEKEDEYALSKFDSVLDKLEAKKGSRELEVHMKKQDGKWMIDDSDFEASKRLMGIFAEGVVM